MKTQFKEHTTSAKYNPCTRTSLVPLKKGAQTVGRVAAARKSCREWKTQTVVFIVDSFCCFVSIVSHSVVLIKLD